MDTPVCRRCLLRDMPENEYAQSVIKYRASLNEKQRTADAEYEARLEKCKACEELENGVCRQCGCYVEMRAAALKMHCPKTAAEW